MAYFYKIQDINGVVHEIQLPWTNVNNVPLASANTAGIVKVGDGLSVANDGTLSNSGVSSFNGSTGAVTYAAPVTSVNGSIGEVNLTYSSVGAAPELNYQEKNFSTKAVSTNSTTTIGNTGSLTGRYLCIATACFATNTSGRRAIWIATSDTGSPYSRYSRVMHAPASGDVTHLQFVLLVTCNNTTLYLRAYQNSGSSLNVTNAGIKLMLLS